MDDVPVLIVPEHEYDPRPNRDLSDVYEDLDIKLGPAIEKAIAELVNAAIEEAAERGFVTGRGRHARVPSSGL